MASRALLACGACALLAITATAGPAEGLLVDRAKATFKTSRKGRANHAVKVDATLTDTQPLRAYRPETTGLRVRVGDWVAVVHEPSPEASLARSKSGVLRFRSRVSGARTKLTLDPRNGRMRLRVRKANAGRLLEGGPEYAAVRLELGSELLQDAVVFDERTSRSAVKWRSLARGGGAPPPEPPPDGEPLPGGNLPVTTLMKGNHSDVLMPGVLVARNETEWQALFARASEPLPGPRPSVDFRQDMVIGVFAGLVSQAQKQEVEVTAVTEGTSQVWTSWRARYLCGQFACPGGGGLGNQDCIDFAPWAFVRVPRSENQVTSFQGPGVSDDCN